MVKEKKITMKKIFREFRDTDIDYNITDLRGKIAGLVYTRDSMENYSASATMWDKKGRNVVLCMTSVNTKDSGQDLVSKLKSSSQLGVQVSIDGNGVYFSSRDEYMIFVTDVRLARGKR
ncbi:MAG: hypothetical protein KC550_02880 [Nanoarchaeota archaeon]|nr:hypothetical protein [Nanoarchaeota archaeon]